MFEFQPAKVGLQFACLALHNESVAGAAIVCDGLAVGTGVIAVMTTVTAGKF